MSNSFKSKYDFDTRKTESDKIKLKYPNKYPVIIHKSKKCNLDNINKTKFLIPGDLTMGQVIYIIRKRIKLDDTETIFLFVNENVLPPTSSTISSIYDTNKDSDGFLYISYCNENVFG